MDKTNRNNLSTPTNIASAQQQPNLQPRSATASPAAASQAQEVPSLANVAGAHSTIGSVESSVDRKLDLSCKILKQLFEVIPSDESAMDKILQMLNKKDPKTQETLVEQFVSSKHAEGQTFIQSFLAIIPGVLHEYWCRGLQNLTARKTVLSLLAFNVGKKSIFTSLYGTNNVDDIEKAENITRKLIFSPVYLEGSKNSIGVFQLAQVVNPESIGEIQGHLFNHFKALEAGAWSETSPEQCALYFAYGFLGKNLDVLGILFSCLESCPHAYFKAQAEQKISELLGYFLNDLKETYIQDYGIHCGDYNDLILYICRSLPALVDYSLSSLFDILKMKEYINLLMNFLTVENSKGQYFLDLIYHKQDPLLMGIMSANLAGSPQAITSFAPLIHNLELPNLKEDLILASQQPQFSFHREELFRFFILCIMLKDLKCLEYFKNIGIYTKEESQRLLVSLIKLAEYLFELYPQDVKTYFADQGIKTSPPPPRELFFEILKQLKHLNVLNQLDLTKNLLSLCLKKDFDLDIEGSTTPNFDTMLQGLQKIGFDLHYIDPETGHTILSEAEELERDLGKLKLFTKLLSLGCNPFLVQKCGTSVYTRMYANRFYSVRHEKGVLEVLGLDKHPFLQLTFTQRILKDRRLDQLDKQGRTPLMLYIMCNLDIKDLFGNSLQKLEKKHLEAKDNQGWTVFDYASNNKDTVTLSLLYARKEALEKKATKPNLFRQAAGLAATLIIPEAPKKDASKAAAASSSSSKRRQARKLKAQQGTSPFPSASSLEITLDYNPETGTSTTSIKKVHSQAADAIAKEEAKAAAKQKKKQDREKAPTEPKKKKGLLAKAKNKLKTVATTLETAKNLATHPQSFVKILASKLSQTKAGERLVSGQKVEAISKVQPFTMLEDGLWLGNFSSLVDLAHEAIGKNLILSPTSGVIKTLEAMDHAIAIGKSKKINRFAILDVAQLILGGSIEEGHGSHLNLHYTGGVLTIPQNKDGSENADIFYIKKTAGLLTQRLRSLLLSYEASQSTLSSSDSSEEDKWTLERINNDGETSSEESEEDAKQETPEPSESSK